MESQESRSPSESQNGSPTKTVSPISPISSQENTLGRLPRPSSFQLPIERPPGLRMTSEDFEAFSQKVGDISLEEAKDHIQTLHPVPTLPDPAEIENRKILEQERKALEEEEKLLKQKENKAIRRDSISFLKRRTSERKANLAIANLPIPPTLTITTESLMESPESPGASRAASPVPSLTPPDSTPSVNMAATSGTRRFNGVQTSEASGIPATTYAGSVGVRNYAPGPGEEQRAISQNQAYERGASNVMPYSAGLISAAYSARVSSRASPLVAPVMHAGPVPDPYASNNGTPPTSAARSFGVYPWQNQGIAASQNQPATLEWLYSASSHPSLIHDSAAPSRETTPGLTYSNGGSEYEFGKRKANSPIADNEVKNKKVKTDVPAAEGSDVPAAEGSDAPAAEGSDSVHGSDQATGSDDANTNGVDTSSPQQ